MTTLEIVAIHNILTEENKQAYDNYQHALEIANSETETIEKMDLRDSRVRLEKSFGALTAFEKHNWEQKLGEV